MSGGPGHKPILGIDLGTTYSLVAVLRDGRPTVLPNALGEVLTPSAVSFTGAGEVLVGAAAKAQAVLDPTSGAVAFKRDMGTDRQRILSGRGFTPQELSALVLGSLKRDAEAALGMPIEEAVVTVPAYFGDLQRQATRDAGAIAGLKVERIINEPTAAALAYGLHERGRELRVAVLDLGGGTFDVTVLEIIEGVIEIQSSAGDARLGGEDFDTALARHVARAFREKQGVNLEEHAAAWSRLREACEGVKRRLSASERTRLVLPELPLETGRRLTLDLELSRDEAEQAWSSVLERVRGPIRQALKDASLQSKDIDEVLLVGGSTRMPCVAAMSAELFGRLPLRKLPPDEAVALGAAVQGAMKGGDRAVEDLIVTDVAPFTLGVATMAQAGRQHVTGVFSPILERGTVIPTSRVERYATSSDFQREIRLEVYQGEHARCEDNVKLGEYRFQGLPPAPASEQAVDVRFTYDLNGILEVEVTVVATGRKEAFVIEQRPGRLTPAQIEDARQRMAALKLHPRDALPNTTALARADALFVELTGAPREELAAAIAGLRLALEAQEPGRIAEVRERLNALVRAFRDR
ncbi:Hsp70 family protein [Corallococcus silvisoli]|uniref:Hsp70 family protein n=1 Tax=Corallococcus silvisoli TaxID=2697031 RepID=UPI0013787127|nr:Hsp70 family protein [Corallococcus silvisoli]NBD08167.1 Hsp70 family protein [Corallococcus silvisoli]